MVVAEAAANWSLLARKRIIYTSCDVKGKVIMYTKDINIKSRIEYFLLGLRDRFGIPFKPEEELNKLNIKGGQKILDYGCGIGSYTFHATNLVGKKGKIYALDRQPLAIKRVEEKAKMDGFGNIDTILSDGDTGLPDETVDVILLYGVLPEIESKDPLLRELYRVLKPGGYLSTRFCFRMKRDRVLEVMKATGLFSLRGQKGHILNFGKVARLANAGMV